MAHGKEEKELKRNCPRSVSPASVQRLKRWTLNTAWEGTYKSKTIAAKSWPIHKEKVKRELRARI